MRPYTTSATIEPSGQLIIGGVPFAPGTLVEVVVSPKRRSAAEFEVAWRTVCNQLRNPAPIAELSDDELQREIEQYRATR